MLRDTDFVAAAPNACYGALAVWGLGLRRRLRGRCRVALQLSPSASALMSSVMHKQSALRVLETEFSAGSNIPPRNNDTTDIFV